MSLKTMGRFSPWFALVLAALSLLMVNGQILAKDTKLTSNSLSTSPNTGLKSQKLEVEFFCRTAISIVDTHVVNVKILTAGFNSTFISNADIDFEVGQNPIVTVGKNWAPGITFGTAQWVKSTRELQFSLVAGSTYNSASPTVCSATQSLVIVIEGVVFPSTRSQLQALVFVNTASIAYDTTPTSLPAADAANAISNTASTGGNLLVVAGTITFDLVNKVAHTSNATTATPNQLTIYWKDTAVQTTTDVLTLLLFVNGTKGNMTAVTVTAISNFVGFGTDQTFTMVASAATASQISVSMTLTSASNTPLTANVQRAFTLTLNNPLAGAGAPGTGCMHWFASMSTARSNLPSNTLISSTESKAMLLVPSFNLHSPSFTLSLGTLNQKGAVNSKLAIAFATSTVILPKIGSKIYVYPTNAWVSSIATSSVYSSTTSAVLPSGSFDGQKWTATFSKDIAVVTDIKFDIQLMTTPMTTGNHFMAIGWEVLLATTQLTNPHSIASFDPLLCEGSISNTFTNSVGLLITSGTVISAVGVTVNTTVPIIKNGMTVTFTDGGANIATENIFIEIGNTLTAVATPIGISTLTDITAVRINGVLLAAGAVSYQIATSTARAKLTLTVPTGGYAAGSVRTVSFDFVNLVPGSHDILVSTTGSPTPVISTAKVTVGAVLDTASFTSSNADIVATTGLLKDLSATHGLALAGAIAASSNSPYYGCFKSNTKMPQGTVISVILHSNQATASNPTPSVAVVGEFVDASIFANPASRMTLVNGTCVVTTTTATCPFTLTSGTGTNPSIEIGANKLMCFRVVLKNGVAAEIFRMSLKTSDAATALAPKAINSGFDLGAGKLLGTEVFTSLTTGTKGFFGAVLLKPTPSVATQLSIFFQTEATLAVGLRVNVLMPGWAQKISTSPLVTDAYQVVGGATSALAFGSTHTFNNALELLSVDTAAAAITGSADVRFSLSVTNPLSGNYFFTLWTTDYHSARKQSVPLVVSDSINNVAVTLSSSDTSRTSVTVTISFTSTIGLDANTALQVVFSGGLAPMSMANNPIVTAGTGFNNVLCGASIFNAATDGGSIRISLTGSGKTAAGTTTSFSFVMTNPATAGTYSTAISGGILTGVLAAGVGSFQISGLLSQLNFNSANTAPGIACTGTACIYTLSALCSAALTGTVRIECDTTVFAAPTPTFGTVTAGVGFSFVPTTGSGITATASKLFVDGTITVAANTAFSFSFPFVGTNPSAGIYVTSCKVVSLAPTLVAAVSSISFSTLASVTANLESTVASVPSNLVISFVPLVAVTTTTTLTIVFGTFGNGIADQVPVLVSGFTSGTTVASHSYVTGSSTFSMKFGVFGLTTGQPVTMKFVVASNPPAGTIHMVKMSIDTPPVLTTDPAMVFANAGTQIQIAGTLAAPIVTSASVASVPACSDSCSVPINTGTKVTLIGSNFGYSQSNLAISHGTAGTGFVCASPTFISSTAVSCVTDSNVFLATHKFIVTIQGLSSAPGGTIIFTTAKPYISQVFPASGPGNFGTIVTLTGNNFGTSVDNIVSVTMGASGVNNFCAPVTYISNTQLSCRTSNAIVTGSNLFVVTTVAMGAGPTSISAGGSFTFGYPLITSIFPVSGAAMTGTLVTLTGLDFGTTATPLYVEMFDSSVCSPSAACTNGVRCTGEVWKSATQITCTTPATIASQVSIFRVKINYALSTEKMSPVSDVLLSSFVFTNAAPTLIAASPASGPANSATVLTVTLSGTNFGNDLTKITCVPSTTASVFVQLKNTTATHLVIGLASTAAAAGTTVTFVVTVSGVPSIAGGSFQFTNPQCSSFTGCSAGLSTTVKATTVCAGTTCTSAECCSATQFCASFSGCPSGQFVPKAKLATECGAACTSTTCCSTFSMSTVEKVVVTSATVNDKCNWMNCDTTIAQYQNGMDCSFYNGITEDNVQIKITMGTYVDYFRPAAGQSLCDLLLNAGTGYRHSVDGNTWTTTSAPDTCHLGGAPTAGAQARAGVVGPYWGHTQATGCTTPTTGGCGHIAAGDNYSCGQAFSLEVQTRAQFSTMAKFNGLIVVNTTAYNTNMAVSGNRAVNCNNYQGVTDLKDISIRITMGSLIDYIKPVQTVCALLTTPETWYLHSMKEVGPYKAVKGQHPMLLGGWEPYTFVANDGTSTTDMRLYGSFWGAAAVGGYYVEPGGCCYDAMPTTTVAKSLATTVIRFSKPFTIAIKIAQVTGATRPF